MRGSERNARSIESFAFVRCYRQTVKMLAISQQRNVISLCSVRFPIKMCSNARGGARIASSSFIFSVDFRLFLWTASNIVGRRKRNKHSGSLVRSPSIQKYVNVCVRVCVRRLTVLLYFIILISCFYFVITIILMIVLLFILLLKLLIS